MTPSERAGVRLETALAIQDAEKAMKERCAQVVDYYEYSHLGGYDIAYILRNVSKKIRELKEE